MLCILKCMGWADVLICGLEQLVYSDIKRAAVDMVISWVASSYCRRCLWRPSRSDQGRESMLRSWGEETC